MGDSSKSSESSRDLCWNGTRPEMTHLLGSNRCMFSIWQVVEMLSGSGEKKPTTKDCISNQVGCPWMIWVFKGPGLLQFRSFYKCKPEHSWLICSIDFAHVLSIFHYGQFFHRYVRWWFKPQNTLELWRFIMVHLHFCSLSLLFVQFPWLLIPVHCCWFNPVLLASIPYLFCSISLDCAPPPFYLVEIVPFPSFLLVQLQIWFISFRFLRLKSFCLQPNLAGSIARSGLWAVHGRFAWGGHIDTPKIRLLPSKVEISMGTSLVHSNIWHYSPSA